MFVIVFFSLFQNTILRECFSASVIEYKLFLVRYFVANHVHDVLIMIVLRRCEPHAAIPKLIDKRLCVRMFTTILGSRYPLAIHLIAEAHSGHFARHDFHISLLNVRRVVLRAFAPRSPGASSVPMHFPHNEGIPIRCVSAKHYRSRVEWECPSLYGTSFGAA